MGHALDEEGKQVKGTALTNFFGGLPRIEQAKTSAPSHVVLIGG
jgi:hypothetical protein